MKSNLFGLTVFCSLLSFFSCKSNNDDFVVSGTVKNAPAQIIYLEEGSFLNRQPILLDSAQMDKNGSFKLKGTAAEEKVYMLRLSGNQNPFASFINDTKHITVTADLSNTHDPYIIKGSPASTELQNYLKTAMQKAQDIYATSVQIDSSYSRAASDSLVNTLISQRSAIASEFKSHSINLANKSKHAPLPVFVIGLYQSLAMNPAFGLQPFSDQEMKDLVNRTASRFPDHKEAAELKRMLQATQQAPQASQAAPASLLNKPAPDFTLPNTAGQPVSLSSLRGKYVLVDFWASWCKPCRMENPNVVKAYQKFNDKNFTVLGVSLDKEKEEWLKAIKQDNLTWTHISDLKFWESSVVPLYNIEGIPHNVLIDPNGVVIGEGLRGEDLEKKLAEVIK